MKNLLTFIEQVTRRKSKFNDHVEMLNKKNALLLHLLFQNQLH